MSRPRRSAPLLVQVVLLLLATLAVAQAVNALVVLSSSPPESASVAWVDAVADALAGRVTNGGESRFTVTASAQPPYDNYEDPEEREFRDALARRLDAAPADVRVVIRVGAPGEPPPGVPGRGAPPPLPAVGYPRPERPIEAFAAAVPPRRIGGVRLPNAPGSARGPLT